MIEFPGHGSRGCADCHSINHQTHDCPYLEAEDDTPVT